MFTHDVSVPKVGFQFLGDETEPTINKDISILDQLCQWLKLTLQTVDVQGSNIAYYN